MTLFAFCYNAAANAVLFMNFVVVSDLSMQTFSATPSEIALTYSLGLLTTLPAAFGVAYFMPRHSYWVFGSSVLFDTLGAWLRWLSVRHESWALCMASTVCIGVAFAVCCMSYAVVGMRWFPPQQRTLATTIGVQSNYAGWCLGALLIPTWVRTTGDQEAFLLVQAVCVSIGMSLFLLFHDEGSANLSSQHHPATSKELAVLARKPSYIAKVVCYATLGAVSYAIPAIQDTVLADTLHASPNFTKLTNVSFIATGVLMGLLFSVCEPRRPKRLIQASFFLAAVALIAASLLVHSSLAFALPERWHRGLLLGSLAFAGGASLGFLGIALAEITREAPEVDPVMSAGAVEWFVQGGGGLLSCFAISNNGFALCAGLVALAACILMYAESRGEGGEDSDAWLLKSPLLSSTPSTDTEAALAA